MSSEQQQAEKRPARYWLYIILGIIAGLAAGYAYYYFVGCRTGACPLRANPYYNMLLGGLMGYIVTDWIVIALSKLKKKP